MRRLVSKIYCKHLLPHLSSKFQPIQLGFWTRGGCEIAVHATRTFLESNGWEVLLKVDLKNAFNSVDRGALLSQVKQHTPSIFPFLWQCYGRRSILVYREHHLSSSVGCQKGDPLGPAIFSLNIHQIISSLESRFNLWYLDDGTLGGDADTVLSDLKNLCRNFAAIGLEFNFSKCEIFINPEISPDRQQHIIDKFNDAAPNIKIMNKDSLRLLGVSIFDNSIPNFIEEKIFFAKFLSSQSR